MTHRPALKTRPVTAVVPAAGASTRFGRRNKLLERLDEMTLLETTLAKIVAAPVNEILVVTGHESDHIDRIAESLGVRSAFNPDFESGLASSIVCGVKAATPDHDILIWPGDMPFITTQTAVHVIEKGDLEIIVVPVFEGRRGHPVYFGRSFREELQHLEGDRGARSIIDRHPDAVVEVVVSDAGILTDIDRADDIDEDRGSPSGGHGE